MQSIETKLILDTLSKIALVPILAQNLPVNPSDLQYKCKEFERKNQHVKIIIRGLPKGTTIKEV